MNIKKGILVVFFGLIIQPIMGQENTTFGFIDVPYSAKTTALGNKNISSPGAVGDLYQAPMLMDSAVVLHAAISYGSFINQTNGFQLILPFKIKSVQLVGSISHFGYGEIEAFDAAGNALGTVNAGATTVQVGYLHTVGVFTAGANVKMAYSNLASYTALAFIADLGLTFKHPNQALIASFMLKNMGVVAQEYTPSATSTLPFDVQIGVSYKPEHMPLRFTLTGYGINQTLKSPYAIQEVGTVDKILSHLNIGGEVLLSKNFHVLLGYNHKIKKEMSLESKGGGAGISYGIFLGIKSLQFTYAKGSYHLGGKHHSVSLALDLEKIIK